MNPTDPELSSQADQELSESIEQQLSSWDPMSFFGEMPDDASLLEPDPSATHPTLEVERRETVEMATDNVDFAETSDELAMDSQMEAEFPAEEFAPQFPSFGESTGDLSFPQDERRSLVPPPQFDQLAIENSVLEMPDWDPEREFASPSSLEEIEVSPEPPLEGWRSATFLAEPNLENEMISGPFQLDARGGEASTGDVRLDEPFTSSEQTPVELPEWDPIVDFARFVDQPELDGAVPNLIEDVSTNQFETDATFVFSSPPPLSRLDAQTYAKDADSDSADESLMSVLALIDAEIATNQSQFSFGVSAADVAASDEGTTADYIAFTLGEKQYAFPIDGISEITRFVRTTPVPYAPEWLQGVTNLRGDVLAVIDLRTMLGETPILPSESAYLIVLQGKKWGGVSVGLLVDGIGGMKAIRDREIVAPPVPLTDRIVRFTRGIQRLGSEFTVILDVEAFLSTSEIQQFFPT